MQKFELKVVGVSSTEHIIYYVVIFTQVSRLAASVNFDMNRVLAILENRMSLDWFNADLLCHQPPDRYAIFYT